MSAQNTNETQQTWRYAVTLAFVLRYSCGTRMKIDGVDEAVGVIRMN